MAFDQSVTSGISDRSISRSGKSASFFSRLRCAALRSFLIRSPFPSVRLSSGYDLDRLDVGFLPPGMRNKQQRQIPGHSYRLPAFLSFRDAFAHAESKRVIEDRRQVGPVLDFVPLETQSSIPFCMYERWASSAAELLIALVKATSRFAGNALDN